MLWIGGGNDLVATTFGVSLNAVTYVLRVAVFVAPVIAFLLTKRICIGLQRSDEERLLHGAESGIIERDPSGRYSERHRPISQGEAFTLTQHKQHPALAPAQRDRRYVGPGRSRPSSVAVRRPGSTSSTTCASRRGPSWRRRRTITATGTDDGHAVEGDGNGHHSITAGTTQQNVTSQSH